MKNTKEEKQAKLIADMRLKFREMYFFDGGRTNGDGVVEIVESYRNDFGHITKPDELIADIKNFSIRADIHYRETFMWIKQAVKRYRKLTGETPPADVILGNFTRRKVGKDVYTSTISKSDRNWFDRLNELDEEYAEESNE